eukprot:scpid35586/ scgid34264/ 
MPAVSEPEPSPAAEAEPEYEPTVNPEAEAEYTSTLLAEPEAEAEAPSWNETTVARGAAEPVPDWDAAIPEWGAGWPLHIYVFGALFVILAVVALCLLVQVARRKIAATRMVTPVLALMVALGTSRAIFLFGDAYGHTGVYPTVFMQLMFGLTMPCITSAYGLQLFSIVQAFHPQQPGSRGRWMKGLTVAILVHFALSILFDVLIGVNCTVARELSIVCVAFFIAWGMVLFVAFACIGVRVNSTMRTRNNLAAKTSGGRKKTQHARSLLCSSYSRPLVIVGLATSCGLCIMCVYVYGLTAVYHMYEHDDIHPRPWPWYTFQTLARALELFMAGLMIYATALTRENQEKLKDTLFIQPARHLSTSVGKAHSSFRRLGSKSNSLTSPKHLWLSQPIREQDMTMSSVRDGPIFSSSSSGGAGGPLESSQDTDREEDETMRVTIRATAAVETNSPDSSGKSRATVSSPSSRDTHVSDSLTADKRSEGDDHVFVQDRSTQHSDAPSSAQADPLAIACTTQDAGPGVVCPTSPAAAKPARSSKRDHRHSVESQDV